MQVYVARYAKQSRTEIRNMEVSTFNAWVRVIMEMIDKERDDDGKEDEPED